MNSVVLVLVLNILVLLIFLFYKVRKNSEKSEESRNEHHLKQEKDFVLTKINVLNTPSEVQCRSDNDHESTHVNPLDQEKDETFLMLLRPLSIGSDSDYESIDDPEKTGSRVKTRSESFISDTLSEYLDSVDAVFEFEEI